MKIKYGRSLLMTLVMTCMFASGLWAQEPDLTKLPDQAGKIKAWIDYCESMRLNNNGAADNFVKLEGAGKKGIQMLTPDDYINRSKFFFYIAIGKYYQVKFDSAQYYFYQSLDNAQKGRSTQQITKACVALIPVNFQLQQTDKVESCKMILQSIVDTTHNEALLQDLYYALGSYYQLKSYYSSAQDYFIKSIKIREKEVDTTQNAKKKFDYAIQCDMLSKLYLNTEMVDKSLDALRKGQRFASVSPNVGNRLLSSFVEAYTSAGNIDSALYYNAKLETETKNNPMFPSEVMTSDLNIALYYINRKQYRNALPFLDKADTVAARVKSPLLTFQVQMVRGRYLQETGKFDQSIALLTPAMPVAKQLNKELYSNILKYLALDEKGNGNMAAGLQFYEDYVESLDSLTKEKISRTFADLETHYQTNEKEQRIQSLDKENRLRTLELQNASHQRQILILGLAALGVISLLLYFNYRNKEKLNRVLNEKNDRLDQMNHHLAEANETKARLFGIIGHDLRSPVSKIVQLLQLQKERPDLLPENSRKQHEERLKKASENVLETMEDLLIWSKSQMQSFTPVFTPVNIRALVDREISLVKQQAENDQLLIQCHIPENFVQLSDENFLTVIVRNLLQNAIRHGDKKTPVVVDTSGLTLAVTNYSEKDMSGILNTGLADRRVDSKTSGLGLQIAADLAARINTRLFFRRDGTNHLQAILSWESAA
jgi:signal transduction histidine kinase